LPPGLRRAELASALPRKFRGPLSVVVIAVLLTGARAAAAQTSKVTITLDPGPGRDFAQQAGLDLASVETQVQTELDRLFQVYRLKDYVRSFGDAQGFTTRGLGVDYGSNVRYLELGVAASAAINGDAAIEGDTRTEPIAGVSGNLTLMAGVSLGALGVPVTIFANYFKSSGSYREFDAKLDNVGVHLQLKLLGSRDESIWSKLVRWGGIDVTTGFDHARMRLKLVRDFTRNIPVGDGQRFSGEVDVTARGTFQMDMRTSSIPLEVTTNLRFLYVLSFYLGGGFDWQLGGRSDLTADLDGRLTGVVPAASLRQDVGSMKVTVTESASPSAGRVRGIVGLQANLFLLKLFVQLNAAPSPFLASVGLGARLVW
jgi:hypothetical protein